MKDWVLRLSCIGTIVTGIVLVMASEGTGIAADRLTDSQKRQRIGKMYADYKKGFGEVQDIDPKDAMELAASQKAVFVDVREPQEQAVSMLPGAITEKEFLKDPEKYRGKIIIGYCTISYRSGKFAQKLKKQGIPVLNLRGGLLAWVHDGGRVYDRQGETRRIHVYGTRWDLGSDAYEAIR